MGLERGSKLLLPLSDGQPIIAHTIRNAASLEPAELVVVIRPDLPELSDAIVGTRFAAPNIKCVPNPHYQQGMGTSLAVGVAVLNGQIEAALVMLGDMPYVSPGIVEALVAAYVGECKLITIPVYGNAVGPPTLFARQTFPDLLGLQGEVGGRQLLTMYPGSACLVRFTEEDRPPDLDTPEDIQKFQ
jgi:molybdenum cofactor cytidylyltransferase